MAASRNKEIKSNFSKVTFQVMYGDSSKCSASQFSSTFLLFLLFLFFFATNVFRTSLLPDVHDDEGGREIEIEGKIVSFPFFDLVEASALLSVNKRAKTWKKINHWKSEIWRPGKSLLSFGIFSSSPLKRKKFLLSFQLLLHCVTWELNFRLFHGLKDEAPTSEPFFSSLHYPCAHNHLLPTWKCSSSSAYFPCLTSSSSSYFSLFWLAKIPRLQNIESEKKLHLYTCRMKITLLAASSKYEGKKSPYLCT